MTTAIAIIVSFFAGAAAYAGVLAWATRNNRTALQEVEALMAQAQPELKAAWEKLKSAL